MGSIYTVAMVKEAFVRRGIRSDLKTRFDLAFEAGVFLTAESDRDARRLRTAYARGDIISPAPCVFALPEHWKQLKPTQRNQYMIRALAHLHPTWVFCGPSAAVMQGLYVSNVLLGKIHIVARCGRGRRNTGAVVRDYVHGDEPIMVDGILTTSHVRTAFDCIRRSGFREGLALADSTLRICGMHADDLAEAFSKMSGNCIGKNRCVETAKLADARSESGGESVARAVMIEAGYLLPELQRKIPNPVGGGDDYRADFYWQLPYGDVVGELDGREKYRNSAMTDGRDAVDVLADERLRESRITGRARVMRFSYADVIDVSRFCTLMDYFGIPKGFAVPPVALGRT